MNRMTDPGQEPEMSKWVTQLAFRLADYGVQGGQAPPGLGQACLASVNPGSSTVAIA
jgi:hypothetical protein